MVGRRAGTYGAVLALMILATSGCVRWKEEAEVGRAANAGLVEGYIDQATAEGLVAERTVYTHYFVADSAHLTPVGRQNLDVLTGYFKQYPGVLNVQRKDASEALYGARLDAVRATLAEAGVDTARMTFREGLPGGPGMSSDRVMRALQRDAGNSKSGSSTTITVGEAADGSGGGASKSAASASAPSQK